MLEEKEVVILTIDDCPNVRHSFCAYLEDYDYRMLEAEDGETGLDIFERKRPDAVLLDLHMPGMDGLEVLERIKTIQPTASVIVISGTGKIREAVKALRMGASNYLLKPISNLSALRYSIDYALETAREAEEEYMAFVRLRESREKFRTLFEETECAIVCFNQDFTIDSLNRRARDFLGFALKKGQSVFDVFSLEVAQKLWSNFNAAIEKDSTVKLVEEIKVGKEKVFFEITVKPVIDTSGRIMWLQCTFTNMPDSQSPASACEEAKRIVELSHFGVCRTDLTAMITGVNTAFCEFLEIENPQSVVGSSVSHFFDELTQKKLVEDCFPAVLERGNWSGSLQIHTLSGTKQLTTYSTIFMLRDEDDNPSRFVYILNNMD